MSLRDKYRARKEKVSDCEWCHDRDAEQYEVISDFGQLRVCEECAGMLLSSD